MLDSRDKNISNLKESLDNSVDRLESAIKTSSGMASSAGWVRYEQLREYSAAFEVIEEECTIQKEGADQAVSI